MSRKSFLILGLFLAAVFLFFNASGTKAATYTWTGGGDGHTWTDPANWGNTSNGSYAGATSTDAVTIQPTASTTVAATSSLQFNLQSLTLGGGANGNGPTLVVGNGATLNASTTIMIVGTSTLLLSGGSTWGSGNLILGNGANNATPLSIGANANFTAATGTVTYTGGWNGAAPGNTVVIATTTFSNLNLTPTSTAAINFKFGSGNSRCSFDSPGGGCTSTTTITNVLMANSAANANFNSSTVVLVNSGTPFSKSNGTFTANGGFIIYTAGAATSIATGTYDNLLLAGGATYSLIGNTAATSTTAIVNGSTLAVGNNTFTVSNSIFGINFGSILTIGASGIVTATGAFWQNYGTVTKTAGGKIVHASSSQFTDSGGNAKSSFNGSAGDTVYLAVTDTSLNYDASAPETLTDTATISAQSDTSSQQTITLTETGNATGIFIGGARLASISAAVSGWLNCYGSLSLSSSFTDSQDTNDTTTATATGNCAAGGGGGGGSVTVAATPAPVTPAPAVPGTPTISPAPAAPTTLESVQTKVASVIAKVAALPANPTASDLASIQAEIAAILIELQSVQAAAQPTPQGAALGFNFVRPLALGTRSTDVSNLQQALKTDSSVYPEGLVTGYFGSATLRAIQRFQEKYGIASSGTAGYGTVGPKTRAKLNELYGGK